MEIRLLDPLDDLEALSRIYEESWKYAYKNIVPQSYLDSIPPGNWIPHLKDPAMSVLVLTDNGRFAGVSSFCPSRFDDFKNYGEIVSIYLLPEYMGWGMGKALLDKTVSQLSASGFKDIVLWVLEDNSRARKFYEGAGFVFSGKFLDDDIGGKALREMAYVYNL